MNTFIMISTMILANINAIAFFYLFLIAKANGWGCRYYVALWLFNTALILTIFFHEALK